MKEKKKEEEEEISSPGEDNATPHYSLITSTAK